MFVSSTSALLLRLLLLLRRWFGCVALHHYVELGNHRGDRAHGCENGSEDNPDRRYGQRDFHEGVATLVLDDDAPYIAFVNQLPDLIGELVGVYADLFVDL